MPEVSEITEGKEISASFETPRETSLVVLPPIKTGTEGFNIRLGMHTDSMGTLLRFLRQLPDSDQLKIEGRVLSDDQRKALEEAPIYRFYMLGRYERGQFTVASSLGFTPEQIVGLVNSGFSPSSLGQEIGYKTGYFNAKELVEKWVEDGYRTNQFLPIMGGVNEFHIGSDTLTSERIAEITGLFHEAFTEQESTFLVAGGRASVVTPPGSSLYPIGNLIKIFHLSKSTDLNMNYYSVPIINYNINNNIKKEKIRI